MAPSTGLLGVVGTFVVGSEVPALEMMSDGDDLVDVGFVDGCMVDDDVDGKVEFDVVDVVELVVVVLEIVLDDVELDVLGMNVDSVDVLMVGNCIGVELVVDCTVNMADCVVVVG